MKPYFDTFRRVHRLLQDWPRYYISRLKLQQEPIQVRLRNGMRFAIRSRSIDLDILDEVICQEVYTRHVQALPPSPRIVDIGAHIGAFTVQAALRWPDASIHAFEPHPGNYELLMRNIELNRCANVRATKKAVAGAPGTRRLMLSGSNTGGHSLQGVLPTSIDVESLPLSEVLDTLPGESADFIKMDCEGSEYEILLSSTERNLERISQMAIEFHEAENRSASEGATLLQRSLRDADFEVLMEVTPAARMLYCWRP